jgi:hypothetical protein
VHAAGRTGFGPELRCVGCLKRKNGLGGVGLVHNASMRSAEQKQSTALCASAGGDTRRDHSETEATGLGQSDEVGGNAPGCGGVTFGSENGVVDKMVWSLHSDVVRRQGRHGARLTGVDKWYNDRVKVFALGQGSFLVD